MLSIRTVILSVVLVVLLLLDESLVTAKTEAVPNPAGDPAAVSIHQEQAVDLKNVYSVLSYRSQFGECFDVPVRELAVCHSAGQTAAQSNRPPLDECFDVPIRDLAACRSAGQTPVQSNRPPLDECFDVSISELASCRSASQKSAP